jgi:hypothetical protein
MENHRGRHGADWIEARKQLLVGRGTHAVAR